MANDRVYMICKKCGDNKLLFKYYPSQSYFWPGVEEFTQSCNDFLNKHLMECHQPGLDLKRDPGFILLTEEDLCSDGLHAAKHKILRKIEEKMNE